MTDACRADEEMVIVWDRRTSKSLGFKLYFTAKPCAAGHVCERFVCNKTCKECDAARDTRSVTREKSLARSAREAMLMSLERRFIAGPFSNQFTTLNP